MAGKKRRKAAPKTKESAKVWEPSYWMIVAVFAIMLSAGLMVKVVFFPGHAPQSNTAQHRTSFNLDNSLEGQILLVSSKFKCSCGGCGELPLIECDCSMPRGAQEEKGFIRRKLREGLTIDQVVKLVEEKYGLRIT